MERMNKVELQAIFDKYLIYDTPVTPPPPSPIITEFRQSCRPTID